MNRFVQLFITVCAALILLSISPATTFANVPISCTLGLSSTSLYPLQVTATLSCPGYSSAYHNVDNASLVGPNTINFYSGNDLDWTKTVTVASAGIYTLSVTITSQFTDGPVTGITTCCKVTVYDAVPTPPPTPVATPAPVITPAPITPRPATPAPVITPRPAAPRPATPRPATPALVITPRPATPAPVITPAPVTPASVATTAPSVITASPIAADSPTITLPAVPSPTVSATVAPSPTTTASASPLVAPGPTTTAGGSDAGIILVLSALVVLGLLGLLGLIVLLLRRRQVEPEADKSAQ